MQTSNHNEAMPEEVIATSKSDALHYAFEVYADVKAAAARNIPEACALYEQFKSVYPGRG